MPKAWIPLVRAAVKPGGGSADRGSQCRHRYGLIRILMSDRGALPCALADSVDIRASASTYLGAKEMHTCMILPLQRRGIVFGGSKNAKQILLHYVVFDLASPHETSILCVRMLGTELRPRKPITSRSNS